MARLLSLMIVGMVVNTVISSPAVDLIKRVFFDINPHARIRRDAVPVSAQQERGHVDSNVLATLNIRPREDGNYDYEIASSSLAFVASPAIDPDTMGASDAYLDGNSWLPDMGASDVPVPWITADLGHPQSVCGIVVSGRPSWESDHVTEADVLYSGDGANWGDAVYRSSAVIAHELEKRVEEKTFPGVDNGAQYRTLLFERPQDARYIKVMAKGSLPGAAAAVRLGVMYNCQYTEPSCTVGSSQCLNGGTCVDQAHGLFSCMCPTGFEGLLCESETQSDAPDYEIHELTCTFKVKDLPGYDPDQGVDPAWWYVSCPPADLCFPMPGSNYKKSRVWGTTIYSDDSATCVAALFQLGSSGLQETTMLKVTKSGTLDSYPGGTMNGITSKPYTKKPWAGYTLTVVTNL